MPSVASNSRVLLHSSSIAQAMIKMIEGCDDTEIANSIVNVGIL